MVVMILTTKEENEAALSLMSLLMKDDPSPDSERGKFMVMLADAIHSYEETLV